ncbi:MAG: (2Fe-2S)-binding protein [Pseudorhodobacter sp.]|nr:(2Fe-2S)-binding protein [Pseudorhodobacter sp.]
MQISLMVNGEMRRADVTPQARLSQVLREDLGLTGLKVGCGEGECGACTVLLDGVAVNSCLMLAFQAEGRQIVTVEGVDAQGLPQALVDAGAVQCGFCTPGMVMAAEALLRTDPAPAPEVIRHALAGNICRCTGFATIVQAIGHEAARRREAMA